jgi:hypothetical protein
VTGAAACGPGLCLTVAVRNVRLAGLVSGGPGVVMSEGEGWIRHGSANQELFSSMSEQLTEFTVTEDHLKLLRRVQASGWDDGEGFGGAALISGKKPYGNSAVWRDIAEILGVPDEDWVYEDGEKAFLTDEAEERLMRLHVEAMFALQIVLAVGEFRPGRYRRSKWWNTDWRLAGDGRR